MRHPEATQEVLHDTNKAEDETIVRTGGSILTQLVMITCSYKQQKFNLFREESEGYAKLVTELNQDLGTVSIGLPLPPFSWLHSCLLVLVLVLVCSRLFSFLCLSFPLVLLPNFSNFSGEPHLHD